MARGYALGLLLALSACASPATPRAGRAAVTLQGGEAAAPPPSDEQIAYGQMAAVAMRQSRFLTYQKRVGLYQLEDPRAPLYPIIRLILERNPYQEIHRGQTKVACTVPNRPGLRGGRQQSPTCGLDVVDVLLQVNAVQILRDSGYVGGWITQVFPGEDRAKNGAFCFIAVWRQNEWTDVSNRVVSEPQACVAGRKR